MLISWLPGCLGLTSYLPLTRETLGVLGVKLEAIRALSAWITSMFVPHFSAFPQHPFEVTRASFCSKVRIVQKPIPPTDLVVNVTDLCLAELSFCQSP